MKHLRYTLILIGFFALGYLPMDARATSELRADFNNDGFDDLAIGVPHEDIGAVTRAGAVNIIYGSATIGLTSPGNQVFSQDTAGIEGGSEVDDQFGSSLAAGDFDGDGFEDLAVGVPGEDIGTINVAGGVNIIYGSVAGLTSVGDQFFSQNNPTDIESESESDDFFGSSLAAGDFDGDGFDDLAVGVPGEPTGLAHDAGAVNIIYGSAAGLTSVGDQLFQQHLGGDGSPASNDFFGRSLAAGDFTDDGFEDLAVGVPGEDIGTIIDAGGVTIMYGGMTGLTIIGDQFLSQSSSGISGASESNDSFASSLAAGDFDGDGFEDLAVGVPGEGIGTNIEAGGVNIVYGSADRLTSVGNQFFSQNSTGILDSSESGDRFGSSVTAGDFDNDGVDDLAVGVPDEDAPISNMGSTNIIYGSATIGLTSAGNQFFSQDIPGIQDLGEADDFFGASVAVGDFNGDTFEDLAIGTPGENIGAISGAGAVNIIYGSAATLTSAGNQFFSQDSAGIAGVSEDGDRFGHFENGFAFVVP